MLIVMELKLGSKALITVLTKENRLKETKISLVLKVRVMILSSISISKKRKSSQFHLLSIVNNHYQAKTIKLLLLK